MTWRDAVEESSRGSAVRREKLSNGLTKTMIRYEDGDGYIMIAKDGIVDYDKCKAPKKYELNGYMDWKPSEDIKL